MPESIADPAAADLVKSASPEVEPDDADVIEPLDPAVVELVTDWEPTTDDELGEDA